ncbi:MAG: toll/interleukin-1 receptor domain-containing protein [Alphaproteobacteria bacterium]
MTAIVLICIESEKEHVAPLERALSLLGLDFSKIVVDDASELGDLTRRCLSERATSLLFLRAQRSTSIHWEELKPSSAEFADALLVSLSDLIERQRSASETKKEKDRTREHELPLASLSGRILFSIGDDGGWHGNLEDRRLVELAERVKVVSGRQRSLPSAPLRSFDASLASTIYSPRRVRAKSKFLVQVWIHRKSDQPTINREAKRAASSATSTVSKRSLGLHGQPGDILHVVLESQEGNIDEPVQALVWADEPAVAQFTVEIGETERAFFVTRVFVNGAPTLRHSFVVTAVKIDQRTAAYHGARTRKYRRAFVSYSSHDRLEVLARVQVLQALGTEVFQDVLNLRPGVLWGRELLRRIAECDIFILFWSRAAAQSDAVRLEIDYALRCQKRFFSKKPEIVPIVLDGPPPTPPPKNLRHLHFGDPIRIAMAAYEGAAESPPTAAN